MEIQEPTFGPKQYLAVKKTIATSQITDTAMYEKAIKKLGGYLAQNRQFSILCGMKVTKKAEKPSKIRQSGRTNRQILR